MQWIIASLLALALALLLPLAIVASKKSLRGKGRVAGAAMIIGLAFGGLFDPAKAAAIENIQKKKDLGDTKGGETELLD
jgi:hypothetical protein